MLKLEEQYHLYRDYLKHEDGLINYRLTWTLTLQGLLFAALGYLANDLGENGGGAGGRVSPFLRALVLVLIPAMGLLTAAFGWIGILAAHRAIGGLRHE